MSQQELQVARHPVLEAAKSDHIEHTAGNILLAYGVSPEALKAAADAGVPWLDILMAVLKRAPDILKQIQDLIDEIRSKKASAAS